MYCLRSFLVLLLLPLPWTPPLFSFLFLLAFYLRKRPCIYCSLLLLGVFTSTCYWNLAPATDSLLTSLASSGTSSTSIPAFISACWCDFNGGALLQPRKILYSAVNTTSTTNGAIALRTLPFESSALDSLPPIRWLSRAIESASKGFTENLLGVKLSL